MESYRGHQISEVELKQVLRGLNKDIHFDMGAALNLTHPRIGEWQGVFLNGRHLTSMGRGMLPEFNIYRTRKAPNGDVHRAMLLEIGWRHTLESLVRQRVPGVTWDALCIALGVDRKEFQGDPRELEVA